MISGMSSLNDSIKNKNVASKFGARLRGLREDAGLTQEQLSSKTGLHVTYISGLERGRRNPTLSVLTSLARAFDLNLSELFDDGRSVN